MKKGANDKRHGRQCWQLPALAAALLGSFCAHAQVTNQGIVYGHFPVTPPPPPGGFVFPWDTQGWQLAAFYPASVSYNFVINDQLAYTFIAYGGIAVNPASASNALVAVGIDYLGASAAIPLTTGQVIGPDAAGFNWISDRWGGSLLTATRDGATIGEPPLTIGYFTGLESAYLGLRFQQNCQTYYGWVRLGTPLAGLDIAWLFEYAYETRPDTAILAGAGIDRDNDGVWDLSDQCSDTPVGEVVDTNGCSIRQLVPCAGSWRNHGEYVKHVARAVAQFRKQQLVTPAEARKMVKEAAQSDCGKPPSHCRTHRRSDCGKNLRPCL